MYWNPSAVILNKSRVWLTLTWDVLKYGNINQVDCSLRLTLTWDVLKFALDNLSCSVYKD